MFISTQVSPFSFSPPSGCSGAGTEQAVIVVVLLAWVKPWHPLLPHLWCDTFWCFPPFVYIQNSSDHKLLVPTCSGYDEDGRCVRLPGVPDCCHLSQAQGGLFPYIRSCKNTEGVSLVPCLTTFAKWELIPPICPVLAGIQVLRWSRRGCNHNRSVKETSNAIADQLPGGKGTHIFIYFPCRLEKLNYQKTAQRMLHFLLFFLF